MPLGIAAAKATAAVAVSGAAGWEVKKGLDAAARKKRLGKISPGQASANSRIVANMQSRRHRVANAK